MNDSARSDEPLFCAECGEEIDNDEQAEMVYRGPTVVFHAECA